MLIVFHNTFACTLEPALPAEPDLSRGRTRTPFEMARRASIVALCCVALLVCGADALFFHVTEGSQRCFIEEVRARVVPSELVWGLHHGAVGIAHRCRKERWCWLSSKPRMWCRQRFLTRQPPCVRCLRVRMWRGTRDMGCRACAGHSSRGHRSIRGVGAAAKLGDRGACACCAGSPGGMSITASPRRAASHSHPWWVGSTCCASLPIRRAGSGSLESLYVCVPLVCRVGVPSCRSAC